MPHEMTQDNKARSIESFNRAGVEGVDRKASPVKLCWVFPGEGALRYLTLKPVKVQKYTCVKRGKRSLSDSVVVMTKRNRILLGKFALFTLQFVNIINITGNSTSITYHLHKTTTTTTRGLIMTVLQDCTFIHNLPSAREIDIKRMRKN